MKKFLLAGLFLMTSAFAGEVVIHEAELARMPMNAMIDSRFQIDNSTGAGSVTVSVVESVMIPGPTYCDAYGRCYPQPPIPSTRTVHKKTVAVEGLSLQGDRFVYAGAEGDIECGTYKRSPVLNRWTIYLSGNCEVRESLNGRKLTVTFVTK